MTESTKVLTLIIGMEIKTYEDLKISANEGNTFCNTTESGLTLAPFSGVQKLLKALHPIVHKLKHKHAVSVKIMCTQPTALVGSTFSALALLAGNHLHEAQEKQIKNE